MYKKKNDETLVVINDYLNNSDIEGDDIIVETKNILDQDVFAIPIDKYLSGLQSPFNLYIRLSTDHYVKVLHRGESFLFEVVNRWHAEGVTFLFILKTQTNTYLDIQNVVLTKISEDPKVSIEAKSTIILGQGDQIIKNFKFAMDIGMLKNVNSFIQSVNKLTDEFIENGSHSFPINFMSGTHGYDHGVSVLMIAGMIAKGQKVFSDKPFRTICLASMFHDVYLVERFPGLLSENIATMSAADLQDFHSHPSQGAEILAKFEIFDNAVLQAIRQHHMRVRGPSFPKKTSNEIISSTSSIVGLADDIANSISLVMGTFQKNKLPLLEEYLDKSVFPNFNRPLIIGTKSVLFKK